MEEASPREQQKPKVIRKKIKPGLILALVVFSTLVLGYLGIGSLLEFKQKQILGLTTDSVSEYQAVFLDNNQVYFGKLVKIDSQFVVLRDIYYLQAEKNAESLKVHEDEAEQLALVALGNEVHGPTNEMRINLEHVLFIEDLKINSKVVSAILRQKEVQN